MIKELMHDPIFLAEKSGSNIGIVKLVYKRDFFDISLMNPGARLITTITCDGTVVFKEYRPGSRKAHSVYKGKCSIEDYEALCERIENCIENADRLDFYVDDASEELKIFHRYGRVQIMDRGLGNGIIDIGIIMREFLSEIQRNGRIQ